MAGYGSGSEEVVIVRLPAELMDHRGERQRGIGTAPGDDDIGTGSEGFGKRESPDIGVGALDSGAHGVERLAGIHIAHLMTLGE